MLHRQDLVRLELCPWKEDWVCFWLYSILLYLYFSLLFALCYLAPVMNSISPHNVSSIRILVTTLSSIGLAFAFVTMLLCTWLIKKRKELRGMTIIRVIFLLQLLESLKCIFDIIGANTRATSDAGCRIFVFFMLVLAAAPLNLSVFCMLYFQSVLIHKVPIFKRRLQIVTIICLVVYSILPHLFTLFIPPQTAGMSSYCEFMRAPSRRLFIFKWLVFYIWVVLACAAGVYSITSVLFVIGMRSKKVQRRVCSTYTVGSCAENGMDNATYTSNAAVPKEGAKLRRRGSMTVIAKTLRSMIWFPIVPIVYLGFNTIYSIVWYRTQRRSLGIFIVDRVLQFLAAPLFTLTFYLNPSVRRALRQHKIDKRRTSSQPSDSTLEPSNLQSIRIQSNLGHDIDVSTSSSSDSTENEQRANAQLSGSSSTLCRNATFHSTNLDSR